MKTLTLIDHLIYLDGKPLTPEILEKAFKKELPEYNTSISILEDYVLLSFKYKNKTTGVNLSPLIEADFVTIEDWINHFKTAVDHVKKELHLDTGVVQEEVKTDIFD